MRYRPRFEQLEARDTPSSFDPASAVVTFVPQDSFQGVPFGFIATPAHGLTDIGPNLQGFNSSSAATTHAGVWGAPMVILNGPV
jgi:hypothetical protein